MNRLTGKTAIVTGASRGIGRAIAERLALEGARVVVNYARNAQEAAKVVDGIRESGGIAEAVQADLASLDAIPALFDRGHELFGPLDMLVNNAGVAAFRPLAEVTLEDFEAIFNVNTRGALFCLKEAARRIRDGGRIVNISTGATLEGPPGSAVYSGSKAALELFGKVLARELAPRGVTVNTVSPGFTDTDMLAAAGFADAAPTMTPLGRLGQPGDIADVVCFLCGDDARWITGQNIQAGGGLNMK